MCWCLSVIGRSATALGIPLRHVATAVPLWNASLGWQIRVGSGVDLLLSCVSTSGSGQAVCVCWGLSVLGMRATALGIPLRNVATAVPLLNVSLGCQVRVGSGVDLLLSCVSASGSAQAVCVLGSECTR